MLAQEVDRIRQLCTNALKGTMDKNELEKIFNQRIGGWWRKYYVSILFERIHRGTEKEQIENEVANLFANVEEHIQRATEAYWRLPDEEKKY